MCATCWVSAGHPSVYNDQVSRAVDLIDALYRLAPTGGPLHVQVDDWNVEGDAQSMAPIYGAPDGTAANGMPLPGYPDRYPPAVHTIADELGALLGAMTVAERYSALAHQDRLLDCGTPTEAGAAYLADHLRSLAEDEPDDSGLPFACSCPGTERWTAKNSATEGA